MQFVTGGRELWVFTLLFMSLRLWGRLSASTSTPIPPAPTLDIYSRSRDSVVLVCRVPEGHRGVLFMLYRIAKEVDSLEQPSGAEEVHFTVRVKKGESTQHELFCCLYKYGGSFSPFSSYLQLDQTDAPPTRSIPSFPPPILSVEPSSGVVKRGGVLSFRCSLPVPQPQYQSQSNSNNKPVSFVLLKKADTEAATTSTIPQPQASQVSNPEPQPGVFSVGPVKGGEEGEYTCIYQVTRKRGLINSTVSNVVHITIMDALPTPTLVLQQQTDVWHLLCEGSPSYPGAVFSLFQVDNELPVSTQHAKVIHHQATFPVPVQDTPLALYQCKYSVLLGREWTTSERSLPLAVNGGSPPPPSGVSSGVDWPLVLGSFSAVVLFLCSVALVVVVVHRKVKAAAEEKKKREEAQFWTQVHAKDHVVDLTLTRASFTSEDWASGDTSAETASTSPLGYALSTFTAPINPSY